MKKMLHKISLATASAGTSLFFAVSPVFAQRKVVIAPPSDESGVVGITNINKFIQSTLTLAIIIAAVLCFAYLVWGGIQWITSGGDKAAYESARNRITAALIGLAIVAAAWALMALIGWFLGVEITNGLSFPTAAGN